jgi:DNA-binding CsgD family transcriptional regulator
MQARVHQLGVAGYSIREIAGLMSISTGTVKSHRNRIRQKVDQARQLVDLFDDS